MRHGLPSPWVAGRTAYAGWRRAGTVDDEKCRNAGRFREGAPPSVGRPASLCRLARRRKVSAMDGGRTLVSIRSGHPK
ncbi:hypothetical protein DF034_23180 [Burkholderia anthina]|nr:hypothetical protein DF034_23180 [Burkholderia anthina]